MLKIRIETKNAAMIDDLEDEIANCLERVEEDILSHKREGIIHDSNGNKVGYWKLTDR